MLSLIPGSYVKEKLFGPSNTARVCLFKMVPIILCVQIDLDGISLVHGEQLALNIISVLCICVVLLQHGFNFITHDYVPISLLHKTLLQGHINNCPLLHYYSGKINFGNLENNFLKIV